MGYTHYWTPRKVNAETWNKFLAVCNVLRGELPKSRQFVICGGNGEGEPVFNNEEICFNGTNENDLGHETFFVGKDVDEWNFCKTARKPYDFLVCGCLIAAREILGYKINSDGQISREWKPVINYYEKTIGKLSIPRKNFFEKTR
jgi:hypothetical protein